VFPKLSFVILSLMVLAACTQPSPALPELTPQTACQNASQCIWAVRSDRCCDCGGIYTLEQLESDPRLLFPSQNDEYDYPVERVPPPAECGEVVCAPCMEPPIGLVCDGGSCRRAETAAEILSLCPSVPEPHRREWCPVTAAVAALDQQGLPEAVEICNQISGRAWTASPCVRPASSPWPEYLFPNHPIKPIRLPPGNRLIFAGPSSLSCRVPVFTNLLRSSVKQSSSPPSRSARASRWRMTVTYGSAALASITLLISSPPRIWTGLSPCASAPWILSHPAWKKFGLNADKT
jgi:hypothetical protein